MKKSLFVFMVFIFVLMRLVSVSIFAQQDTPNPDTWITNHTVFAIACSADITYIGGHFTYLGKPCGHGVPVDINTGVIESVYPIVNDRILAAAADGYGGWYIGGGFTEVGGISRNNIAHILFDGTVDLSWDPNVYGPIYTLTLNGNTLYVGGRFSYIGGQIRRWVAAIDTVTGQPTDWNPTLNNEVDAIAVNGNTIYIGGHFTSIGGQVRHYLGAIDAVTSQATYWAPEVYDINNDAAVLALVINGSNVYVGGTFTAIGDQSRSHLAAVDAVTGEPTSWNPDIRSQGNIATVLTMAVKGNTIYVGGRFTSIGDQSRKYLAALDTSTGLATAWDPKAGNIVRSMGLNGDILYVGGAFSNIGGQNRLYIAAIDTDTALATPWNPTAGNQVYSLAVSDEHVYIGGVFTVMGGVKRNYIAAIDVATGQPKEWDPCADNDVKALLLSSDTVYAGGSFRNIGGQNRRFIAAINASTGQVTPWNPTANGTVNALTASGNTIYVGGSFRTIGGLNRNYIAAFDISSGLVTDWNPNANGMIRALAVSGDTVYVGGEFTNIGGQDRNYFAAVDAVTGQVIDWDLSSDKYVYALTGSGDHVYVGGSFTTIAGQNRYAIAKLDLTTWEVTDWNPNILDGLVLALVLSGRNLYVGGTFSRIGGDIRKFTAAVDTFSGDITPWNPNPNHKVYSLASDGNSLYIGGSFNQVGSKPIEGFARFDGVISTHVISGTVTAGANPVPGVTLTFSHNNDTTTTDDNGRYCYTVSSGTTTTITPGHVGYCQWSPPYRNLTNITSDETDQDFQCTPIGLVLTSPNGGEAWGLHTARNITWTAPCLSGNVHLLLCKDGKEVGVIAAQIPVHMGSYTWNVGALSSEGIPPGSGYLVKIITQDGFFSDTSDSSFSIEKPRFSLTCPRGGESWKLGTLRNITWSSLGLTGNVKLLLLRHGKIVGNIAVQIPIENGSYLWIVGNHSKGTAPSGSGYRIKAYTEYQRFFDANGKFFTITDDSYGGKN